MWHKSILGFLDELTGSVQWGFLPNLWPKGSVQRLDNWGWQIHNCNVVMRSIDPTPKREYSKVPRRTDVKDHLWQDLFDTLESIPLKNAPLVNGFPVMAEIPRAFVEKYDVHYR